MYDRVTPITYWFGVYLSRIQYGLHIQKGLASTPLATTTPSNQRKKRSLNGVEVTI